MIVLKLALRNLMGAGLRTWLNVFVLSITFVMIVGLQGMYDGMNRFASRAMIDIELGGGQVWSPQYDPYDPLTLDKSHGPLPDPVLRDVRSGRATPILVVPGAVYPEGRMQSVVLKGIDPDQDILGLPSSYLKTDSILPGFIGARAAKALNLKIGDEITARLRDKSGTFDAVDITIVHIMRTSVPTVDAGQIWLPLTRLQTLTGLQDEATLVTYATGATLPVGPGEWITRDLTWLLRDITAMIDSKKKGALIIYGFLLFISLLAVFDTQILAVFRRQREMGTLIALGMTRSTLIQLFTLEGAFHGILALGMGIAYGAPLLWLFQSKGLQIPDYAGEFGLVIADRLFPYYGPGLILGTAMLALVTVTLVSYWPTRKIAALNPTEALRGKRL